MGHKPHVYTGFNYHGIKEAMKSFNSFDTTHSHTLSHQELQNMLKHVFSSRGNPPPSNVDVAYLLYKYKFNNDYNLSEKEVARLLKELCGFKNYD